MAHKLLQDNVIKNLFREKILKPVNHPSQDLCWPEITPNPKMSVGLIEAFCFHLEDLSLTLQDLES